MSFISTRARCLLPARANASRFEVIRPMRVASSYIIWSISRCSGFNSSSSSVCAKPEMIAAGLLISWATPLAVDHHDRIRHGVHEQTQIALRAGGGGERVHQRPGLAGDLVLEQRGVAPVGARGVD